MQYYHKFSIAGFLIGLLAIIFGITALLTPVWIKIQHDQSSEPITYGLLEYCQTHRNRSNGNAHNETVVCENIETRLVSQYVQITGCVILFVGLLSGVLCTAFVGRRNIHLLPPIILFIGIIWILFGLIFFIKHVVEIRTNEMEITFQIGYSLLLMLMTCVVGIFLFAYFSFTAGYIYHRMIYTGNIY